MKLAGIFFLSVLPLILTFRMGEDIRLREKRRKAFLELLCHVHFQIENFNQIQKEIFNCFENDILRNTEFYRELEEQIAKNPCGAFGAVWENHASSFGFDSQVNEILDRLAKHFGLQEKNAQLEELERAIGLLEKKSEHSKTECENRIKILRMTGLTAGLGILIILL